LSDYGVAIGSRARLAILYLGRSEGAPYPARCFKLYDK